ncbi:unnamed protein product [Dovyalis caffra]|uniref:MADS-box domain-containing protein n=1 Tax=Dovyalis caffra TaxID=77055 RepID=A0AAV1R9V0_9ROSI|nr:unnamed protein product [Dovyalis caffra]
MEGKKTRGRQKVEMKRIENEEDRLVSFSKRRSGIYKKASELVTLTGSEIAFVTFSPGGKPFSFSHPSVEHVTNRFLECPSNIDSAQALAEAYRRTRIEELTLKYCEMERQLDDIKEKGRKLKDKIVDVNKDDWWNTPIEELNVQELIELEKKFEDLRTALHNKIMENNNGASSSHALERGNASTSNANDSNVVPDHGSDWGLETITHTS